MKRKRWTSKEMISADDWLVREKRKWQIALRRYVFLQNAAVVYAPYFGLDAKTMREWISLQFDEEMNWDNFSTTWQFEHIIPIAFFDLTNEQDLKLCWNFINLRAVNTQKNKLFNENILWARTYFLQLFQQSGYALAKQMVDKIDGIINQYNFNQSNQFHFLQANATKLQAFSQFDETDFFNINKGMSYEDVLTEKQILAKFAK
ncbi:MAG: hypothetical protein ACOVNR_08070 [Chitinophagaceae bacterium]